MMNTGYLLPEYYTGLQHCRVRPLAERIACQEENRVTAQDVLDEAAALLLLEDRQTELLPLPPTDELLEAVLRLRLRDPVGYQRRLHAVRPPLALFDELPPHTD